MRTPEEPGFRPARANVLFETIKKPASSWRWVGLLMLLSLAAIYPALVWNSGAFAYDAALEHIYRAVTFSQAIGDGVLYPRWVQFLHVGLGSPLFTFQGPLPYFVLDVLYRLGLPHPLGWRLLISAGLLAASTGTFLLLYEITKQRWPALVAAVAFLYAPYVLRNTLQRGSNEAFSMVLYPWVLWALIWLAHRPGMGRFLVATLLWTACIAAHVLGPLMIFPVAGLLAVGLSWRYRTWTPLLALIAGGLLAAFIWAPMIPEQAFVHVERNFSNADALPWNNPIPLESLLAPPAVYDVLRDNNGPGDRVGLLQSLLLLLGVPAMVIAWRRGRRDLAIWIGAATLVGLVLFWLFTGASDWVWRLFAPILGRIQYRTRLMGMQALAAAVVAGLMMALLPPRWQRLVAPVLAAVLVLVALPSLYIELQHRYAPFGSTVTLQEVRETEARLGGKALTAYGEFTPRWREAPFDQAAISAQTGTALGLDFDAETSPLAGPSDGVQITASEVKSQHWDLAVEVSQPTTLTLNLLYYPRWQATVGGQSVPLSAQPVTGLAQLRVPAGNTSVVLRYGRTAMEWAGFVVSGLTVVILAVLVAWSWRRRWSKRQEIGSDHRGFAQMSAAAEAGEHRAISPPLWMLVGIAGLLLFKGLYVDRSTTWLRCSSTAERVCGADATVDVAFDGTPVGPSLRGYTVPSYEARPGKDLQVTLYWQGVADGAQPVQSFVHVRNSQPEQAVNPRTGSDIWAQDEHPAPGGLSTTEFLPGRIYLDAFRVPLPDDMPPGEYFLEVGWFDPTTGEQLAPSTETMPPPLRELWRSVLLPSVTIK